MEEVPRATVFASAADFRAWLEANHGTVAELWVGYYKKGVRKVAMTYQQAVEEALCFGWIDGQVRRIDDEVVANRYTPRRRTSSWSAVNIAKIAELTAAGRMHPAGLRAFQERDRRKDASYSSERPALELPDSWLARLRSDEAAWRHWQTQPASYRRQATHWVMSAVRPATRERRFATLLSASAAGTRPAPFLVTREERGLPQGAHASQSGGGHTC